VALGPAWRAGDCGTAGRPYRRAYRLAQFRRRRGQFLAAGRPCHFYGVTLDLSIMRKLTPRLLVPIAEAASHGFAALLLTGPRRSGKTTLLQLMRLW
jgi:hypothetical protein